MAQWINEDASKNLKRVVVGAENDFIVDDEGVKETAKYFGTNEVFLKGAYHDIMLGSIAMDSAKLVWESIQS